jgi:hypothetical protein
VCACVVTMARGETSWSLDSVPNDLQQVSVSSFINKSKQSAAPAWTMEQVCARPVQPRLLFMLEACICLQRHGEHRFVAWHTMTFAFTGAGGGGQRAATDPRLRAGPQ